MGLVQFFKDAYKEIRELEYKIINKIHKTNEKEIIVKTYDRRTNFTCLEISGDGVTELNNEILSDFLYEMLCCFDRDFLCVVNDTESTIPHERHYIVNPELGSVLVFNALIA